MLFAGFNGAIATALAAMASHSTVISQDDYLSTVFEKANTMHFYHVLVLMVVVVLSRYIQHKKWCRLLLFSGSCFALGLVFFCFSLYLFVFSGVKIAGFVTPLGGSCFILGWLVLMCCAGGLLKVEKNK